MEILNHFNDLTLTQDQHNAVKDIADFFLNNKSIFLLKGYAGTGKTTLLKGIAKYLNQQGKSFNLLAPTGRAAMVLKEKTGFDASTIHRHIYNFEELHEIEEQDGNSFKFCYKLNQNSDSVKTVYFIDEASMVSDHYSEDEFFMFGSGYLLKDLFSYVFESNKDNKIIFIGDNAQLPPVNMSFSPALSQKYLKDEYNHSPVEIELKKVVRQQEGGILGNATKLRNSIENNKLNEFTISEDEEVVKVSPENTLQTYKTIAAVSKVKNCIIITHSNKQALGYNLSIRKLRYSEDNLSVRKDDRLIITKNNYNGKTELYNGMFAKVIEVGDISKREEVRFKIKDNKTKVVELIFREINVEVNSVEHGIVPLKTTVIDDFLTSEKGRLDPYHQRALYIEFKERMRQQGIRPKTPEFNDAIRTDKYFNALQAKYGYAITCHKSQGGEWENVFVDFKVFIGKMSKPFFRWAYTGITRAKKKLFVIDAPAYNALSEFVISPITPLANVMRNTFYKPILEGNPNYFIEYRRNRIDELCQENDINVEFSYHNNQLATKFIKGEEEIRVRLWYNAHGFSNTTWQTNDINELRKSVEEILINSLLHDNIPFNPSFDFQKDLHEYILEILNSENIPVTNIVQKEWSDFYFIYTGDKCAVLEFNFNHNHIYTICQPKSTLGNDDAKLLRVIEKLRGDKH